MSNNSVNNQIGLSTDDTVLDHQRSQSGEWDSYNDQTDTFGFFNRAGSPETFIAANIGSICTDTTNGDLYIKQTDTVPTGWVLVNLVGTPSFFQAFLSVTQVGATGGGAVFTPIFDSEVVDTNGDYDNTTGIYTAPIDGRYSFSVNIHTEVGDNNTRDGEIRLVTTSATYLMYRLRPERVIVDPTNDFEIVNTQIVQLSAGDTVRVDVVYDGGGAGTTDIIGNVTLSTTGATSPSIFSGFLINDNVSSSASGKVVQISTGSSTANTSTTSIIPIDGTQPQSGEGASYMSLAFTPMNASNRLFIEFWSYCSVAPGASGTVALFDTVASASALSAVSAVGAGQAAGTVNILFEEVAASTAARTYSIRFGPSVGGIAFGINGGAGGVSSYGASDIAMMRIWEVTP